jgi:hypothetical protein
MPRYTVNHNYTAYRDGQSYGPWEAGTEVELTEPDAEWVNRDSPTTLTSVRKRQPAPARPADQMPTGPATIKDWLAWVGTDPQRAADALAAEQTRDKPRATLIDTLRQLAAGDTDTTELDDEPDEDQGDDTP